MATADECLVILPEVEVIGLSFTAFAGFLSAFAVIFVLLLVARNYMRNVRNPPPGGEWKLIRTHVDAYLLSLLASDFMQSLGAILDIKWAAERKVYCSPTCTAQGIIQVIGETGVAMATFAITLHTFLVIFFRWSPSPRSSWIWKVGISFIWLYVSIYAIAGYAAHHRENGPTPDAFYTPTPYWCWISNDFNAERITAEYLWLWFAAFSSIILYTFLFFRVRGNITVDPHDWRRVRFKWKRWQAGDDGGGDGYFDGPGRGARGGEAGKTAAREAMSMIWYPLTYTVLVLPLSIVRWSTFRPIGQAEPHVPFPLTSVVVTVFGLSGIANVVLILFTRKNLLLFGQRGVVNPAKIAPAAAARLAQRNQREPPPAPTGPQEKRRFNFANLTGHKNPHAHANGKRVDAGENSTDETSGERERRRTHGGQGDTSFAAGRFTTQAFETERSFDLGSGGSPYGRGGHRQFTGMDATETGQTSSGGVSAGTAAFGKHDGYGIPEGMSHDLGSRGEYDLERSGEGGLPMMGSIPIGLLAPPGGPGAGSAGQTVSSGLETQGDTSHPSNFLEMKDSRSNPGQPELESTPPAPLYPPQPAPPTHAPPAPTPAQQQQHYYAEGRRPSASTVRTAHEGSRPNSAKSRTGPTHDASRPGSAKSRAGSSYGGRRSGDAATAAVDDYSVPMKFNPTPPPPPPPPPPPMTTATGSTDAVDSTSLRFPYISKSRNGSSKSLGKASSSSAAGAAATTTTPPKSTWSQLTNMFSKGESTDRPHRPPGLDHPNQQFYRASPFDDTARVAPHEALELARTRTGSWSRASAAGAAGSRRNLHSEEDSHHLRPNTAGSSRSLASYTFGQPATAAAAAGDDTVGMQPRAKHDSSYPPMNAQTIGRAL